MALHLPQQHDTVAAVHSKERDGDAATETNTVAGVSLNPHSKKSNCSKKCEKQKKQPSSSSTSRRCAGHISDTARKLGGRGDGNIVRPGINTALATAASTGS
jgi:hypothetical protein